MICLVVAAEDWLQAALLRHHLEGLLSHSMLHIANMCFPVATCREQAALHLLHLRQGMLLACTGPGPCFPLASSFKCCRRPEGQQPWDGRSPITVAAGIIYMVALLDGASSIHILKLRGCRSAEAAAALLTHSTF